MGRDQHPLSTLPCNLPGGKSQLLPLLQDMPTLMWKKNESSENINHLFKNFWKNHKLSLQESWLQVIINCFTTKDWNSCCIDYSNRTKKKWNTCEKLYMALKFVGWMTLFEHTNDLTKCVIFTMYCIDLIDSGF